MGEVGARIIFSLLGISGAIRLLIVGLFLFGMGSYFLRSYLGEISQTQMLFRFLTRIFHEISGLALRLLKVREIIAGVDGAIPIPCPSPSNGEG